MSIKCGNHNGTPVYHNTIADVRACYDGFHSMEFAAPTATEPAPAAPKGDRLSDIPAETRKRVLDNLARSAGITDAEREAARGMWSEDARPAPAPVATVVRGDATDKQISYLRSLLASRAPVADADRAYAGSVSDALDAGTLSKRDASHAITKIKDWAYAPRSYTIDGSGQGVTDPRGEIATEDGIYRDPRTGRIFKVQWNRASGDGRALYAKRLIVDGSDVIPLDGARGAGREVDMTWVYAGGLAKAGVEKAWRMNRKDAARFGALYGVCVRCHRDLTDEQSIDRAMGPVCAGKMGW